MGGNCDLNNFLTYYEFFLIKYWQNYPEKFIAKFNFQVDIVTFNVFTSVYITSFREEK